MNFLQRALLPALRDALRPGGLLVYETFGRAHIDELGREFNPDYVLGHNELLRAFGELHVRHYREGVVERGGGQRGLASIVAQRLVQGWSQWVGTATRIGIYRRSVAPTHSDGSNTPPPPGHQTDEAGGCPPYVNRGARWTSRRIRP